VRKGDLLDRRSSERGDSTCFKRACLMAGLRLSFLASAARAEDDALHPVQHTGTGAGHM
jgi:hypothetical protein